MTGEILVPLRRNDRIEQIVPYLEDVARPGMRVVFLIRYPVDGFRWLLNYVAVMETGNQASFAARKVMEQQNLEEQKEAAKRRLSSACEALRKRGVEIAVEVHARPLRLVVGLYATNGDLHCIVIPAGNDHPIIDLLSGSVGFFRFLKRPGCSPVLVLQPDKGLYERVP